MKKNQLFSKTAAIGAAVAMSLAAQSLAAQASPAGFGVDPMSKTRESTAGRMRTDTDNFLSVLDWSKVKFDKAFGFIGYNASSVGPVNLGFATKTGSLFLGTFYAGNIVSLGNKGETESVAITYSDATPEHTETGRTTITSITNPDVGSLNNIGLLIGLGGNMGIRVGFYENLVTRSDPSGTVSSKTTSSVDGSYNTNEIADYSYTSGNIVPSISWGMVMPVGSMTLKPKVDAALNIYYGAVNSGSYEQTRNQIEADNTGTITTNTTTKTTTDNGYINPVIQIGADLDFAPGEGSVTGLSLAYKTGFQIYGDEYGTLTDEKNKLSGDSDVTKTFKDNSASAHVITPSLRYTKTLSDRLALALRADLPLTFGSSSVKDNYEKVETAAAGSRTTTGQTGVNDTETTTFNMAPLVTLGAQFKAVPNRFTLNTGIRATVTTFTSSNVKTTPTTTQRVVTKDAAGNVVTDVTTVLQNPPATTDATTSNWSGFSTTLSAGFTFFFTDNITADVGFTATNFTADVSSLGVLFTVKK